MVCPIATWPSLLFLLQICTGLPCRECHRLTGCTILILRSIGKQSVFISLISGLSPFTYVDMDTALNPSCTSCCQFSERPTGSGPQGPQRSMPSVLKLYWRRRFHSGIHKLCDTDNALGTIAAPSFIASQPNSFANPPPPGNDWPYFDHFFH
jgi:hypothetical protein